MRIARSGVLAMSVVPSICRGKVKAGTVASGPRYGLENVECVNLAGGVEGDERSFHSETDLAAAGGVRFRVGLERVFAGGESSDVHDACVGAVVTEPVQVHERVLVGQRGGEVCGLIAACGLRVAGSDDHACGVHGVLLVGVHVSTITHSYIQRKGEK